MKPEEAIGLRPRIVQALGALAVATLVSFCGFLFASCLSGRAAARRFVDALHDHRLDDARGMLSADLQRRVPTVVTAPPPTNDPERALALLFSTSAMDVRWRGLVQSGFTGNLTPYACFDGAIEPDRPFWIVVRRSHGAWQVTDLRLTKPEVCEGDHG